MNEYVIEDEHSFYEIDPDCQVLPSDKGEASALFRQTEKAGETEDKSVRERERKKSSRHIRPDCSFCIQYDCLLKIIILIKILNH